MLQPTRLLPHTWLFGCLLLKPRCRQTTTTRLQGRVGRGCCMPWNRQKTFGRYDSLSLQDSRVLMDGGQWDAWCVMRNWARFDFFKNWLNPNQIERLQFWTEWTSQNWAKQTGGELGKHLRSEQLQIIYCSIIMALAAINSLMLLNYEVVDTFSTFSITFLQQSTNS